MYVLIDNSGEDKIVLYYYLKGAWSRRDFSPSKDLLVCFTDLLADFRQSPAKLKGLAVLLGAGRFTATRVAVTLANTLGLALKIPVIGVKEPNLPLTLKALGRAQPGKYVSATYSAGAHISGRQLPVAR